MPDSTADNNNTAGTEQYDTDGAAAAATAEAKKLEDLPTYWQGEIRSLRDEAAKHRTAKQEYKAQLEAAKPKLDQFDEITEKHEALLYQHETANAELGKLKAALEAQIPADRILSLASRIQGNTPEEWKEDAKALAEMVSSGTKVTPATDPSQGNGGVIALNANQDLISRLSEALK